MPTIERRVKIHQPFETPRAPSGGCRIFSKTGNPVRIGKSIRITRAAL